MTNQITLISVFLYCINSFAQYDRILCYSFNSQLVDTIEIPNITPKYEKEGNPVDQEVFSFNLDSINLLLSENSNNISDLLTAETSFDLDLYPISTITKIKGYKNGEFDRGFSGVMIGDRWLLTAAHCLRCCPDSYWFQDSLMAYTGYNGKHSFNSFSNVKNAYVYESFANGKEWKDIAILELEEPIGNKSGWIGIKPITTKKEFNNIFFKFSYPAESNPDSTKKYTGEEMQFMYVKMKKTDKTLMGTVNKSGFGIFGESGCALFKQEDELFYAVGVLTYSERYQHYKISPEDVSILNLIIKNYKLLQVE
ncbi:MAG: hypothetical protein ACI8Q1_003801 [Parvicella sp.]|jgi:hypothetical protein